MTQITTHHPRSGWKEDEARLLFDTVRAAAEDGRSLREVFQEVGGQLQRKPNSIRNYYYARVRETPDLSPRPTPFRAFTPEELHTLLREVLMGRGQGESVRACVTRLSGGDRSQMLRMQNKYRSVLKNRPELLMEAAEELRQEGLDVLILGCTHYPLLTDIIREIMGPEVSLVNAGAESVHTLHDALARRQLLAPEGTGQALLCTSDRPEGFGQMARRFLQEEPTAPVRLVDIERY